MVLGLSAVVVTKRIAEKLHENRKYNFELHVDESIKRKTKESDLLKSYRQLKTC